MNKTDELLKEIQDLLKQLDKEKIINDELDKLIKKEDWFYAFMASRFDS